MKVTEQQIRPKEVFDEYLKLTKKDVETFFNDVPRHHVNCPACGATGHPAIQKQGFIYEECPECKTLYVCPRPVKEAFDTYYSDSPSTKFWATTFYKVTEAARREKLWKPKARLVKDIIDREQGDYPFEYVIDIGGGYGVFDEEIQKILDIAPVIIEPSVHLSKICRKKGFAVIEKFMEDVTTQDLPLGRKCFLSFELFEHLYDPGHFLTMLYAVMSKGDIFIFTTLSGMGVDIQVLGENSRSVSPPHHLNFFNPKSVERLLKKIGFSVLDVSTPGKLDMDILQNNVEHIKDRFWKNFMDYATQEELDEMQQVIVSQKLSSHMMIYCLKEV